MHETLRPRNLVAFGMIGVTALVGVDRFVDYQARHAGRVAGAEAREEIEEINIADQQWARLQELMADSDLRELIIQQLEDDGISDVGDVIEALDD